MRTELADATSQNLRALALSGKLPAGPNIGLDPTAESDESQTSPNTLSAVVDSGSQEPALLKTRRQRMPKQTKPEPKLNVKISKARQKPMTTAKPLVPK